MLENKSRKQNKTKIFKEKDEEERRRTITRSEERTEKRKGRKKQ